MEQQPGLSSKYENITGVKTYLGSFTLVSGVAKHKLYGIPYGYGNDG